MHDREHAASHFVLKRFLAKLALKRLPEVRGDFGAFIDQSFAVEPLFEALYMDLAHATAALAWADQLIARLVFGKTDTADHLATGVIGTASFVQLYVLTDVSLCQI